MMLYGQSAECRWKLLHEYFADSFPEGRCGHCDNCLHPLEERLGLGAAGATPAIAPASAAPAAKRVKGKKRVEFVAGDAVKLPRYGRGRVVSTEDDKVEVKFPDGETRTFKREFVRKG